MITSILNGFTEFFRFTILSIPLIVLGWFHISKTGLLYLYQFWNKKIVLDKIFFLLLFFQLILSALPWFRYEVQFFDSPESVNIGPKWNFFFILVSLFNFFFLGFWKSSWVRIWFFSTQILLIIIMIWGYLEPNRYYYDLVNKNEIQYNHVFYVFCGVSLVCFGIGFLTFQKEDEVFQG